MKSLFTLLSFSVLLLGCGGSGGGTSDSKDTSAPIAVQRLDPTVDGQNVVFPQGFSIEFPAGGLSTFEAYEIRAYAKDSFPLDFPGCRRVTPTLEVYPLTSRSRQSETQLSRATGVPIRVTIPLADATTTSERTGMVVFMRVERNGQKAFFDLAATSIEDNSLKIIVPGQLLQEMREFGVPFEHSRVQFFGLNLSDTGRSAQAKKVTLYAKVNNQYLEVAPGSLAGKDVDLFAHGFTQDYRDLTTSSCENGGGSLLEAHSSPDRVQVLVDWPTMNPKMISSGSDAIAQELRRAGLQNAKSGRGIGYSAGASALAGALAKFDGLKVDRFISYHGVLNGSEVADKAPGMAFSEMVFQLDQKGIPLPALVSLGAHLAAAIAVVTDELKTTNPATRAAMNEFVRSHPEAEFELHAGDGPSSDPFFGLSGLLINKPNDGMVSVDSQLGIGTEVAARPQTVIQSRSSHALSDFMCEDSFPPELLGTYTGTLSGPSFSTAIGPTPASEPFTITISAAGGLGKIYAAYSAGGAENRYVRWKKGKLELIGSGTFMTASLQSGTLQGDTHVQVIWQDNKGYRFVSPPHARRFQCSK